MRLQFFSSFEKQAENGSEDWIEELKISMKNILQELEV